MTKAQSVMSIIIDNRFEVKTALAQGGFGAVFRALDQQTGQQVAVKMLLPDNFGDAETIQRFQREAQVCQQLQHPNAVTLVAVGDMEVRPGQICPYLAFELVRGLPLGDILDYRKSLTVDEAVHIIGGVLGALEEAHDLGIVHRDIKPNNIMLSTPEPFWVPMQESGPVHGKVGVVRADDKLWQDLTVTTPRVVDFGYAKVRRLDERTLTQLTEEGTTAGTIPYMSPEQITGNAALNSRADIYSLAFVTYHLLAGSPPFLSTDVTKIVEAHFKAPLPPLPKPWTGHPINAVLAKAAAKLPGNRFESARDMAEALEAALKAGDTKKSFLSRLLGRGSRG